MGRAIRDSGMSRGEIFVTTKLPAEVKHYDEAKFSFETTMAALEMDYVDLHLIHAPWPWSEMGKDCREGNIAVWRAIEEIQDAGRARSIGVSNFDVDDLESLTGVSKTVPQVNQIRCFVGCSQDETSAYCSANDILVEGYSPLAPGAILDNADVARIAEKYGKSVAQLCIRRARKSGTRRKPARSPT